MAEELLINVTPMECRVALIEMERLMNYSLSVR